MMNIKRAAVLGIALSTLFCVPAFAKTEGQWVNDGRQFQKPDGTLAYNEWIEGDNGSFFYVGADGNYVTGWRTIRETNGEATHEYYFNPADGAMFYSTYTPDGFWVNGDGVKVEDPAAAATETAEGAQQETAQTEAQTQAAETAAETADSGQQAEAGSLAEGYSATAAAELLALLNQERSNAGQEPLAENEDLRLAAEVRAKEIAENPGGSSIYVRPEQHYMSETGAMTDSSVTAVSQEARKQFVRGNSIMITESAAWSVQSPEEAVADWFSKNDSVEDKTNKKYILDTLGYGFDSIGVSCYVKDGRQFYSVFIGAASQS